VGEWRRQKFLVAVHWLDQGVTGRGNRSVCFRDLKPDGQ